MRVKIFLNRDNVLTFGLLQRQTPVDAGAITRVILQFKKKPDGATVTIDSDIVPLLFDWTQDEAFSGETTGVLKLKLGAIAGVAVGTYQMSVVAYDPANTGGIVWAQMIAKVEDDAT